MRLQNRLVIRSFIVVVAFSICFAFVSPGWAQYSDYTVKVMTRNMYPGADLDAIAQAGDPTQIESAVQSTIASIIQSRIPARAALVAAEIAENKPDLIALQEATIWKIKGLRGMVVLDQLDLLMDWLRFMGMHYRVAVIQKLTNVELPNVISYTDNNVVLVRSDTALTVLDTDAQLYNNLLVLPALGDEITVLRGWIAVDVKIRGRQLKFVNTHLEAPLPGDFLEYTQGLQFLQAGQLVQDLSESDVPVILAGDFNSNAEPHPPGYPPDQTQSYGYVLGAGYIDPWHQFHSKTDHGYTWPLLLDMPNYIAQYRERIDFAFSKGLDAASIKRIGANPVLGLYASDHAGIVAVFELR